MKLRTCIVLLLSAVFLPTAGTIHLTGTVTDEKNQFIEGAVVTLQLRDSLETRTDGSGYFELTENTVTATVPKADIFTNRNNSRSSAIRSDASVPFLISIYDFKGRLVIKRYTEEIQSVYRHLFGLQTTFASGVYLITARGSNGSESIFRYVLQENSGRPINMITVVSDKKSHPDRYIVAQTSEFRDILMVSAEGTQTVHRAVVTAQESDILIKLMPEGVNYVTPGVPVFTSNGGSGDITTYGSVSDPKSSEGGACNYGATGIKYYAAINVSQFAGDERGQWNNGRCCGRCARVRIRTAEGEERTTVVRIVDKCPDDNCGIDLGGAPAGEIMIDQPGRYAGEWEWVNCNEYDGVSDGPPSLYVKEGSNEWWSLVQVRNGAGGVSKISVRKADGGSWLSMEWATEAENFFTVPAEMLQDEDDWELEVKWETGSGGSLLLPGNQLAIEDTLYQLQVLQ